MIRRAHLALPIAALALVTVTAQASDWPGWLGPNQDGTAPATDLFAAKKRPALEISWKHDLGTAYSGVAVAGGAARGRSGYQSPIVATIGGETQIVAVSNSSVMGLGPADGAQRWRLEHGLTKRDGWSTPIRVDATTFVLTGQTDSVAVRVDKGDGGYAARELWRTTNLKGNFAMPVAHEGHLYGFDGDFLTCVEATKGEQKWKSRNDAAGLIVVDGHLILYASDGHVLIGLASTEGFEVSVKVKVADKAGFTFPSFADARIDIAR